MSYSVEFSPSFWDDFDAALSYIRSVLKNRIAADSLLEALLENAELVAAFPTATEPCYSGKSVFYRVLVGSYFAYYTVEDGSVVFRRFLYAPSDQQTRLS